MTHLENLIIDPLTGVAKRTMIDQYLIESLWSTLKFHSASVYHTRTGDYTLEYFLYEAVWHKNK